MRGLSAHPAPPHTPVFRWILLPSSLAVSSYAKLIACRFHRLLTRMTLWVYFHFTDEKD